ncbi:MAG: hypothetical protein LBU89_05590 [Fibromonadaceae bacterium]|jgi:hypothetical protein|nr:hypothetical protein [Fibromonadaceae bacterium]
MKKVLFGILFFAAFASSAITQRTIVGNWSLAAPQTPDPSSITILEKDTLRLMLDDWKFTEAAIYSVHYPEFGADKIELKYKLKVSIDGDYRLERGNQDLRKYPSIFTFEIMEGTANNEEAAQSSLRDVERMIREQVRKSLPILLLTETEMELQGVNGNLDFKYTKPKALPISQLTRDTVPFFAPEEWRFPNDARELASFPIRRDNSNNLLTYVKEDFNGDGLIDAAAYLLNPEKGQVALFINLSQSDGSYELKPYGNADRNTIVENGIMPAPPGEYVTVSREKIILEKPGFIEVIFGTTAYLIYWDSKTNDWVKVQIGRRL